MAVRTAPCDWVIDTAACPDWDQLPADVRARAETVTAGLLWKLTGRRFGTCPVTIRPCHRRCDRKYPRDGFFDARWPLSGWPVPHLRGGWFHNMCGCRGSCDCVQVCEVALPGPVADVTEVRVDGVILDSSLWHVEKNRILVRGGGGCWPDCQDPTKDIDEPGTFAVTFDRGVAVPPDGEIASGIYACEIAKLWTGDKSCRLPRRLVALNRQGVEMTFSDPAKLLKDGLTGVWEVDLWIKTENPSRLPADSTVWVPGQRKGRRRT